MDADKTTIQLKNREETAAGRASFRDEILVFLFLTLVLIPALAVAAVGGYGLLVWVYQLIAGPPGPPVPG